MQPDTEVLPPVPAPATPARPVRRWWVPVVLAVAVLFNVVVLHGELRAAAYPNQSGTHAAMVRWAELQWSEGRVPLDGWWPYLSAGLPQFHQAESAPHVVTSVLGLAAGADAAYRIVLFLLLALWPMGLYAAARVAGIDRVTALGAAALGPLLVSAGGTGYEYGAYVWAGRGFFAQLWGMWLLPLAWATCWRAVRGRLNPAWAAAAVSAAFVCHFLLWPYLLAGLVVPVLVWATALVWRALRSLLVLAGAAALSVWTLVPLLADREWANQSPYLVDAARVDAPSFWGALARLVSGEVYDAGRVPILTLLVAAGLVLSARRARTNLGARGLLGLWAASLLLWAGWPLWTPLFGSLAGGTGTTPPQTLAGLHLSGLAAAGVAFAAAARAGRDLLARRSVQPAAAAGLVAAAAVVLLAPAWVERAGYGRSAGMLVARQSGADRRLGPDVDLLAATAAGAGPGRVAAFGDAAVGDVDLAPWLLGRDVEVVGYVLQTSSLSSDPEATLEDDETLALATFGVRYLIGPAGATPNAAARIVRTAGSYSLWELDAAPGYVRTAEGLGPPLEMDRTDVGAVARDAYVGGAAELFRRVVAFAGAPAGPVTAGQRGSSPAPPGTVTVREADLAGGTLVADVDMSRRGYLTVAATMHGRWRASVDGAEEPVWMLAPSFFGVVVEPGRHTVLFRYERIGWYPWLFLAGGAVLCGVWFAGRRLRPGQR